MAKIPSQVVSVKPQSKSVVQSLSGPGNRSKNSGKRHSSPLGTRGNKIPLTNEMKSTPPNELSSILEYAQTPSLHMASSTSITTSTPFNTGHNLSTVVLDNIVPNNPTSFIEASPPRETSTLKKSVILPKSSSG